MERGKMSKVRDQANRLYGAEEYSGIKYRQPLTLKECQKFADKVVARKYVKDTYGSSSSILVLDGRGRRKACASFQYGRRVIKLPKWARTEFVILHEIAHHLVGLENGHRPAFASCLLDLVRHFLGKEAADGLQVGYHLKGVKVLGKNGATKARCPQSKKEWLASEKEREKRLKEKLEKVA